MAGFICHLSALILSPPEDRQGAPPKDDKPALHMPVVGYGSSAKSVWAGLPDCLACAWISARLPVSFATIAMTIAAMPLN